VSNPSIHPHRNRARKRARPRAHPAAEPAPARADRTAARRARAPEPRTEERLAALLADPAVIAGGETRAEAPPARGAARATSTTTSTTISKTISKAISKTISRTTPTTPSTSATATASTPPRDASGRFRPRATQPTEAVKAMPAIETSDAETLPADPAGARHRGALLDATRARRLAREARLRERDSREALDRAREAIEPNAGARWERRPLAQPAAPIATAPAPIITPAPAATKALPVAMPAAGPTDAERALAAELREARATLAIARETAVGQREEIAHLRVELALRDETLTDRSERLDALLLRFEAQEHALEQARQLADHERRRHVEVQATLDRLRAALRGVDAEADSEGASLGTASAQTTLKAPAPGATTTSAPTRANDPSSIPESVAISRADSIGAPPAPTVARAAVTVRAPIFELWREEQIRRNFGPLGIDGPAELLREPLARRARRRAGSLPILMLGHGAAPRARALADDLLRIGAPAFVLHVADADAPPIARRIEDDPLQDTLRMHPLPESPDALAALARRLAPAAVFARDFLTWQPEVDPWLAALRETQAAGACLLLFEETGLGAITPSAEIAAIGERIWAKLPERYTRAPGRDLPVATFGEAFAGRVAAPSNGLMARLRGGFELELCAQFGFLSEAFVAGPVARCFDADNPRDERFLRQIADLDDRRLESGSAPALHLIARIDADAPR